MTIHFKLSISLLLNLELFRFIIDTFFLSTPSIQCTLNRRLFLNPYSRQFLESNKKKNADNAIACSTYRNVLQLHERIHM
jgi:hypothetical protein